MYQKLKNNNLIYLGYISEKYLLTYKLSQESKQLEKSPTQ